MHAPWKVGHALRAGGKSSSAVGCVLLLLLLLAPPARADSFVRRLAERALERGMAQEARGDIAQALTSYDEAVRTDSTLGMAALRLGALRERLGDAEEAEVLYSYAASTPDTGADAHYARALLRHGRQRRAEALADLAASVADSPVPARLRLLADWYVEARLWPAALATWRALYAADRGSRSEGELRELELTLVALSWLASDTDPVLTGRTSTDWVRRSLARAARPSTSRAHGARKLTP